MINFRPRGVPLKVWRHCVWITLSILFGGGVRDVKAEFSYEAITAVLARITVNYADPTTNEPRSVTAEIGRFADGAIGPAGGVLIAPKPYNSTTGAHYLQGCSPDWAYPAPRTAWIALLLRGGCSDAEKVLFAIAQNASAVLLFGSDNETYLQKETKFKGDVIVVYLLRRKGEQLVLLANVTKVYLSITQGQEVKFRITSINRTSVLFVSVSFIVLMVVSLAWLIFYYIQRFRYINAKDKLARHLCHVAKKALAKVPVKSLKNSDKEIEDGDSCAVCIETYQVGDTIRNLPCKHHFHKSCIDPWLLEHRTCPMCKMDILIHYGFISNNCEGGDHLVSAAGETSSVESGASSTVRNPPVASNINSYRTPQVSVISHSEIPAWSETVEHSSSNPVGDSPLPVLQNQQNSGFGTATTAVIRSMLISARARVVPVINNGNSCSDSQEPVYHAKEVANVVSNTGCSSTTLSEDEEAQSSPSTEVSCDISSTGSCSSLRSDNPENAQHSQEKLIKNSDTPSIIETARANGCEICDFECLVKEIMDLEQEDISKPATRSRSHTSVKLAAASQEMSPQPEIESYPKSECPVAPPTSTALPAVDCNQKLSLSLDRSHSLEQLARLRTVSGGPGSSQQKPSELENPSSREDESFNKLESPSKSDQSPPPTRDRRPSSHLVTISHS